VDNKYACADYRTTCCTRTCRDLSSKLKFYSNTLSYIKVLRLGGFACFACNLVLFVVKGIKSNCLKELFCLSWLLNKSD
jgi:hypothetical protein